jgi:hypothetical protein
MYRIPQRVATTTALAAGGLQPIAGFPPLSGVQAFNDVFNTTPVALAPGASIAVAWPAVPVGQRGLVVALAWTSSDPTVVTYQTRKNAVGVLPYATGHLGDLGLLTSPFSLVIGIPLTAGDVFDLFVTNTGAAGITFQTRSLGGFFL